jgi:predicted nucleotidyltransferase
MNKSKIEILSKIKKKVMYIEPDSEVILFGSQARNEEREDSDWDILILTSEKATLKKEQEFRHELFYLELEYGVAFSTFVYSKDDWNHKYSVTPLYSSIKKDGIKI